MQKATPGSAGYDLVAAEAVTIEPGNFRVVRSTTEWKGVGRHALLCPRSGLAGKQGVTVLNGPGVIDADYEGNVSVVLINFGGSSHVVRAGDRIAQLVFIQVGQAPGAPASQARTGGFGSTGT